MDNPVLNDFFALENENQKINLSRFFKTGKGQYGEGDLFLGIKVPQTRELVKKYWKKLSLTNLQEFIISPYHEIRLFALLVLVKKFHSTKIQNEQQSYVDFYLANTQYINNWDLVDLSCYEILGTWLLNKDRKILYNLATNKNNLWEQRIAIVSCMKFVKNNQFTDCLNIADILLYHPHDLIHKAVGWLLREVGKKNEQTLISFLATRYKTMPRTTLRYAIEKFPPQTRTKYLKGEI